MHLLLFYVKVYIYLLFHLSTQNKKLLLLLLLPLLLLPLLSTFAKAFGHQISYSLFYCTTGQEFYSLLGI